MRCLLIFLCVCSALLYGEEPKVYTNKGEVTIGGERIPYTVKMGNYPLVDENKKQTGTIYWISYTKDVKEPSSRPLSFCFNGGPGSSSIWLHLGALSPRKIAFNEQGFELNSLETEENPFSILNVCDLVFIDPVSTGYSRAMDGEEKQFHGVEADVKAVAECIRRYTTEYKRWASPKFLIGESYGTTRAACLSSYLKERYFMNLNGVVLVSMALNFQTFLFEFGNDLPFVTFLPTYTANAWYHKKLSPDLMQDLHQALAESSQYALGEYTHALMKGDALNDQEEKVVASKLARLTGLSEKTIKDSNLRVCPKLFRQELLEGKILGRFDGRLSGFRAGIGKECIDYDPSTECSFPAFTSVFNHYVANTLQWESQEEYQVLTNVFPWDFGKAKNRYLNVSQDLREAIIANPLMRVLVMSGYYDLALPFMGAEYTIDHLYLPKELRGNVEMEYYPSGHMMYLHQPSLKKMHADLVRFISTQK